HRASTLRRRSDGSCPFPAAGRNSSQLRLKEATDARAPRALCVPERVFNPRLLRTTLKRARPSSCRNWRGAPTQENDLPVSHVVRCRRRGLLARMSVTLRDDFLLDPDVVRSEEHTSELQSRGHLVCRLLLEKKKKKTC